MGNFINHLLDNLLSTLWRFLDLPLFSIIITFGIVIFIITFGLRKIFKKTTKKSIRTINLSLIALLLMLIIDKKLNTMRKEINFMNEKISNSQMGSSNTVILNKTLLYDLTVLKDSFPQFSVYDKPINEAIDLISLKAKDPNSISYIAIVDLNHPNIEVKVTPEKKHKYKTSTFAEENDCILAINGEAGVSAALDCELGEWVGNWISDGKVVMMADTDKRPFIGFSKNNSAHYYEAFLVDTILDQKKYNSIWGRFDILVNDKFIENDEEDKRPYARTVMGLNTEGNLLYLMIVDGKRPDYSVGLSYRECAKILKSIGASHAMACDQGGSSCMYIKPMGGIINRPADSDGLERKIYSHFGISMR